MILKLLLFSIFLIATHVYSYKVAVFSPDLSSSQFIWNKRVCEKLVEAGHDVTMIQLKYMNKTINKPSMNKAIKTYTVLGNMNADIVNIEKEMAPTMFGETSMLSGKTKEMFNMMIDNFVKSCEYFISNKEFMDFMVNEKFDIAFSHMYEYCPIGIIHHAKIPSWIWMSSGALVDHMAYDLGVPLPSSYVPPMMADMGDKMTFYQRIKSFIGHTIYPYMYHTSITDRETELFRRIISPDFPSLRELSKNCSLAMVNSNELYDIPKPTLHKIINIGGLGMSKKDAKPLEGIFKEASENKNVKGMIVFTFGSVANATFMPIEWKQSFMKAFAQFQEYEFFFRYDGNDMEELRPKNVHLLKWLPQADLLQHPKTKMIITHGGYNSLQESILAGIPMLCVPLFGDQPRNSRLAEKHGFGLYLAKSDINQKNIYKSIKTIIDDDSYSKKIKRIQQMILKQPVSSEDLLLKWTEFLAEFKTLENMVPYGTKLGFIQYYQVDVIVFLLTIILSVFLIILFSLKKLVCCITKRYCGCTDKKQKKE
uniref:glucuronosyltransferase n=1 Tax=Parastrongyloides trichosuri TaxID=131310 RepID=A0A0N4ZAL4_PARTI